jgi:hypothetical protein
MINKPETEWIVYTISNSIFADVLPVGIDNRPPVKPPVWQLPLLPCLTMSYRERALMVVDSTLRTGHPGNSLRYLSGSTGLSPAIPWPAVSIRVAASVAPLSAMRFPARSGD